MPTDHSKKASVLPKPNEHNNDPATADDQKNSTITTDSTRQNDQLSSWRGVATESASTVSSQASIFLQERSRRLLAELVRPYARYGWLLVLMIVVENAARLAVPKLVQVGIDEGVRAVLRHESTHVLLNVVIAMVAALVLQVGFRTWFLRLSGRIGQEIMLEIRRRVFKKFQLLDVAFHDRYTSGRVVSRLTNDIEAIQELVSSGLDSLISAALTLGGVGIILLVLDWRLGLVCLASFPVILLIVQWFSARSTKAYRRLRESAALVIVQFIETMSGIRVIQSYRREEKQQKIFAQVSGQYLDANVGVWRLNSIFMPAIKVVGNITIGLVLIIGGLFVMHDTMTVGVLTAFLLYLRMFFEPMAELTSFYNSFQSAVSALENLSGVLEEQPSVVAPQHPIPLSETVTSSGCAITFNHVQFGYLTDRAVLHDLQIQIPAGQTVALVGTTGAGKTTMAKLIARFYDPSSGEVLLDGIDLRDLSENTLRRAVVFVTQENFMFDGTISENIAFGDPTAGQERIEAAAQAVGADEFIAKLRHGYQTNVGKRGSRLSAGQRQLVAFARVFLANPRVVILDEATSSLDISSERRIQSALGSLLADRTAIVIAHRLSTVEISDRVVVIEDGRIIEDGSPAELLTHTDGHYASLHQAWVTSLA